MRQAGIWDSLGAMLIPAYTLYLLLEQQIQRNHEGLIISAHIHSWGQIMNKKQQDQNHNCNLWGAGSKSTVPVHDFCRHTTKEMGRPLKTPLEHHPLDPLPVSTHGRSQLTPAPREKARNPFTGSCTFCCNTQDMQFLSLGQDDLLEENMAIPPAPVYSSLENPTDRGARQVTVHGVAKSWTWRGTHTGCNISPN